jgi:hypothetical protein
MYLVRQLVAPQKAPCPRSPPPRYRHARTDSASERACRTELHKETDREERSMAEIEFSDYYLLQLVVIFIFRRFFTGL